MTFSSLFGYLFMGALIEYFVLVVIGAIFRLMEFKTKDEDALVIDFKND